MTRPLMRVGPALVGLLCFLAPAAAIAQDAPGWPRVYLSLDGTYRAIYEPYQQTQTYEEFAEEARVTARYSVTRRPTYSGTFGLRIWRALGAGVAMTQVRARSGAEIEAAIPHPFFFDQYRTVSGTTTEVTRTERAIHAQVRVFVPIRQRFTVVLYGGPSQWRVDQAVLDRVDYTSEYPYDTATFQGATLSNRSVSAWGYNGGVDISAYFTHHVGVGGLIEISTADLPLERPDGSVIDANVGGFRLGAGLRLRF